MNTIPATPKNVNKAEDAIVEELIQHHDDA